ncbi:hypothetical protein OOT46_24405 [Aquabacterium sp. A7-Y]|uniref:hypothetical protein n=1 Tax=Aquabacterium sp. A7-Y TaxID=1349605 RepID=UPI00223D16F4|nr:hypothetical protein [Aquabacterium sp. A7-Y]MCW7540968.1 hypothetical protein [Aquabacterium sp. A7-Y]
MARAQELPTGKTAIEPEAASDSGKVHRPLNHTCTNLSAISGTRATAALYVEN